jgi:hypothetical protein
MKQRRSFDGLIRHRKKLIGPLSAIRVGKRGELITFVSWADDGAAELLWLCCLVQQYGFDRCLALTSALARVAQTRDMKDRARFLFFSRLASVDVPAIKEAFEKVSDPEIVATYWQLFHFFASISGIRKRRLTRAKEMACLPIVSGAVRPATDKENPLALKAMALLVKCEIESDHLVMDGRMLSKVNPYSLDDYPSTLESRMTAGFLRAFINGTMMPMEGEQVYPRLSLNLWPALTSLSECE